MPVRMTPTGPDGMPTGPAVDVPDADVQVFADRGYTMQSNAQRAATTVDAARSDYYSQPQMKAAAVILGVARSKTGGLSDAAVRVLGSEQDRELVEGIRTENPYLSAGGEIIGSFGPGVGGLASKAGKRVSGAIGEAGAVSKLAGATAGGVIEGGIQGVGEGISQVSLSKDPVTLEHAASVIGSNALFGGAVGGGAGFVGKGVELGLVKAKSALDKVAEKGAKAGVDAGDEFAGLDRKGLKAAEKAELEVIEQARVPQRAAVADEIRAFRSELKESKFWLATKGSEVPGVSQIGARTRKADMALDKLLDDPKLLAESPKAALKQLRIQESALDELITKHDPALRASFAADASGTRAAALDYASTALEKNRALQAKITDLSAPAVSPRLEKIAAAHEALSAPKLASKVDVGDALGGMALGHMVSAATGIPFIGEAVLAGKAIAGVVKKLGVNTAAAAERSSRAVQSLLDVTKKVTPHVPVVATRVLGSVRYAQQQRKSEPAPSKPTLAHVYKQRADELLGQVMPGPDGTMQMHPVAREQMASSLAGLRAYDPVLADKIETHKARAIEFLASKLPKKPDIAGMRIGPDTWKPSDMEMRQFARYAAAVEDPHGVLDRASSGTVSPEDAEALRSVYPELHADFTRQVIAQVSTMKKPLPYARRLSLSILTGVAVDPALDPRVLGVLQSQFKSEEGSEGGTQAPIAQPQFGSVSKPTSTPAQARLER